MARASGPAAERGAARRAKLSEGNSEVPSLGATIRGLRRQRGMSLQELATASGISIGMLSQVERDLVNPTVRVLTGIRRALNVPLGALFYESPEQVLAPSFVRRAGTRPIRELAHLRKELLTPPGTHGLQLMILHVDPGGSSGGAPLSYPAEKGGMVLEGEIELTVGSEVSTLAEGDSFLFDSMLPHSFRNLSDRATKVFWIIGAVQLDRHV